MNATVLPTSLERLAPVVLSSVLLLIGCSGSEVPEDGDVPGSDTIAAEQEAVHPGDAPPMEGMEMEGAAGSTVELAPGQADRIGLRWGTAAREPIVRTVRLSATMRYPESRMRWVSPKVSGWVERLHVTFEGAPVRAGQPLMDLYSPELVTAQEELLLARRLDRTLPPGGFPGASDAGAEGLEQVARRRLAYWDIPDAQVERLLETGEVRRTMTLLAPTTGVVMEKRAFEGQGVKAGENLFMIAPTDPVWIEAAVHERDLPFVREGHSARVTAEGLPGRTFRGRISYLYPQLRESTRTVVARIEVPNPGGQLRPGMYATVRIESRTEPVLSVPTSAVLHTGTRSVVFMAMGENRLMPMAVETGRAGDERVEVLGGLEPGTRVATSAQFLLDSEANLMEAMQAMMAEMGRAGEGGMEMDDTEMEEH
jgi:multidrug efflux pump subunit AcrA (membrane-fusion protein)